MDFRSSVLEWQKRLDEAGLQAQQAQPQPKIPELPTVASTPAPAQVAALPPAPGASVGIGGGVKAIAGAVPLPPQAAAVAKPWWPSTETTTAPRLGETYMDKPGPLEKLEAATGWDAPDWLENLSTFGKYMLGGAKERVEAAYHEPELRYKVDMPATPSKTLGQVFKESSEKLEDMPIEKALPASLAESGKFLLGAAGKALEPVKKLWEKAEDSSGAAREVTKLASAGLQLLQEPAMVPKQLVGAAAVPHNVVAQDMDVKDWAPIASVISSLTWGEFKDKDKEDIYSKDSTLGKALQRVKDGEDPYKVAEELYDPWAEAVVEIATDPFNILDYMQVGNKLRQGKALGSAERRMATAVDASPVARKMVDSWVLDLNRRGKQEAEILETVAQVLGDAPQPGLWDKLKRNPVAYMTELVPSAKADRDLSEFWIAASGPMSDITSADEALDIARRWADAPDELAKTYGRVVTGPAGTKSQVIWKHLADKLPDLPSMKAEQFNPVHFLVESTELAEEALRAAYGYKEPGPLLKVLNGYKALQSEFYLSGVFSPGYVMRNAASDLFTMSVDGLGTFEKRTHIDEFMGRLGVNTRRVETRGKIKGQRWTGMEEGKSMLPGPLGKASIKGQEIARQSEIGGVLALGEEPRYSRAMYKALTRFLDTNALSRTPDVPTALRYVLGDITADALREGVARGMNPAEKMAALNRVLDAQTPMQAFEPARYLDPKLMDSLDPQVYKRLVDEARALPPTATQEDWSKVIKRVSDTVDAEESGKLSRLETLPVRKVATDVEESELVKDMLDELRGLAKDPDPEIAGTAGRMVDEFEDLVEEIAKAREEAIVAAKELGTEESWRVLLNANQEASRLRAEARATVDAAMQDVRKAYQAREAGAPEWAQYFFTKAQGELDLAKARGQAFTDAQDHLRRLRNGEDISEIIGKTPKDMSLDALRKASRVDIPDAPAGYLAGSVRDATENAKFDQMLANHRAVEQAAEAEAWRAAYNVDPAHYGDVLDILHSADADVALEGRKAAAKVREVQAKWYEKAKKTAARNKGAKAKDQAFWHVFENFYTESNDIWKDFREYAIDRWGMAQRDTLLRNFAPGDLPNLDFAGMLPGDAEKIRDALRVPADQWDAATTDAVQRWVTPPTEAGKVPGPEQLPLGAAPDGGVSAYTREQFVTDLRGITSEDEADNITKLYDAIADTWALKTGRTPGEWYSESIARLQRGGEEAGELLQATPTTTKGAVEFLDDGRAIIKAFEQADVSTMAHEVAHVFRRQLDEQDLYTATYWATGAVDGKWDVAAEEKFARGFERYLIDGVAPSPELKTVFERFKEWLTDIYRSITGSEIDVDLNDKIKGVFDRVLAEAPPARAGDIRGQELAGKRLRPLEEARQAAENRHPMGIYDAIDMYGAEGEELSTMLAKEAEQFTLKSKPEYVKAEVQKQAYVNLDKPKYKEAFGKTHEITREKVLTAEQQRVLYWELMGIQAPPKGDRQALNAAMRQAKEYRQKNADLADWYYTMAHAIDKGQTNVVPPEWIAKESLDAIERLQQLQQESGALYQRGKKVPRGQQRMFGAQGEDLPLFSGTAERAQLNEFVPEEVGGTRQFLPGMEPTFTELSDAEKAKKAKAAAPKAAPKGEQASLFQRADPTTTPQFREWFGDSRITDRNGRPQVVYHGTTREFESFQPATSPWSKRGGEYVRDIYYFSTDPKMANAFAGGAEGARVIPVYVSLQNPVILNEMMVDTLNKMPERLRTIRNAGFDGAMTMDGRQIVAFSPEQIKSTFAAHFDPSSPNILRQETGRSLYDQLLTKAGAGEAPNLQDLILANGQATKTALRQIEEGVLKDWDTWQPAMVDNATRGALYEWMTNEVMPSWWETRATGLQYATTQADTALLDYSKRRNFDTWISTVVPYHYWFTRSGYNWGKRLATNPAMLNSYVRTRDAQRMANENAGRRQRFGQSVPIPFPWLPDWMGDKLYVDPLGFVMPFSNFMQTNWDDADEARTGLAKLHDTAGQFGFRPYHPFEYLYQSGKLSDWATALGMNAEQAQNALGPEVKNSFPFILPQTQLIRSLTAGKGQFGPQGLNIESPLRRAIGLPAGDIWDPYRVSRMVANMAAESPQDMNLARTALMAQEILNSDPTQAEKIWETGNQVALQAQQTYNWSDEEVQAAQALLAQAMTRAQQERGVGMAGWMLGPRMSIEPAGERTQMELQQQARGKIWTEDQPEGSRAGYQQFKMENPAVYPRSQQYDVVPGEKEYEGMEAGARANWLASKDAKDKVKATYDQKINDLLRQRPWDWSGRSALLDQRKAALDKVDAKYPLPEFTGDMPAILYGMNPTEMWDSVVEDMLWELKGNSPKPDQFKEGNQVNWSAYYDAVDQWKAGLPKTLPGLGQVQAGTYQGLSTSDAVEALDQKSHSPLEAANRVYQEYVASPAWDQYNKLAEQRDAQWPGMAELEDQYYQWPKGSQQRREFLAQHPRLKEYWDYKRTQAKPYDATVGQVGPVSAVELIPAILEMYKAKGWTEAELKKALKGVTFPALQDQKSSTTSSTSGAATPSSGGYSAMADSGTGQGGYGQAWWEKYPKKYYPKKPYPQKYYPKKQYSNLPYAPGYEQDEEEGALRYIGGQKPYTSNYKPYEEEPEWTPRRVIYGGPRFGR